MTTPQHKDRKPGYYRVKLKTNYPFPERLDLWRIAEWDDQQKTWWKIGVNAIFPNDYWAEIDPHPISAEPEAKDGPLTGSPSDYDKQLKPCPFCGGLPGEAVFFAGMINVSHRQVKCIKCSVVMQQDRTDKVICVWNTRVAPHVQREDSEAVKALAEKSALVYTGQRKDDGYNDFKEGFFAGFEKARGLSPLPLKEERSGPKADPDHDRYYKEL